MLILGARVNVPIFVGKCTVQVVRFTDEEVVVSINEGEQHRVETLLRHGDWCKTSEGQFSYRGLNDYGLPGLSFDYPREVGIVRANAGRKGAK